MMVDPRKKRKGPKILLIQVELTHKMQGQVICHSEQNDTIFYTESCGVTIFFVLDSRGGSGNAVGKNRSVISKWGGRTIKLPIQY